MRGIRRLLVVTVLALVGFAAALVRFSQAAEEGCIAEPLPNPAYEVELVGPIEFTKTNYELTISREGEPVTGARVCLDAAMGGMSAMSLNDEAEEVAPGRYELYLPFQMPGPWDASVLVDEPGRERVALPLSFDVDDD
ncbi:MAG: FixH family protein [Actinobacteria bacterium]|nr:FixH family protein [Actinomycetota bacterium]